MTKILANFDEVACGTSVTALALHERTLWNELDPLAVDDKLFESLQRVREAIVDLQEACDRFVWMPDAYDEDGTASVSGSSQHDDESDLEETEGTDPRPLLIKICEQRIRFEYRTYLTAERKVLGAVRDADEWQRLALSLQIKADRANDDLQESNELDALYERLQRQLTSATSQDERLEIADLLSSVRARRRTLRPSAPERRRAADQANNLAVRAGSYADSFARLADEARALKQEAHANYWAGAERCRAQALQHDRNDLDLSELFNGYVPRALPGTTAQTDFTAASGAQPGDSGGGDDATMIYNEGVAAANAGFDSLAVAKFEQALGLDPSLTPAMSALGIVYLRQQRFGEAATLTERLLAIEPDDLTALWVRWQVYLGLGEVAKAEEAMRSLASRDPKPVIEHLMRVGHDRFSSGDIARAIAHFESVLALDANHPQAHYYLGISQTTTGDNASAKAHLQKFIELAPDDPEAPTAKDMLTYLE